MFGDFFKSKKTDLEDKKQDAMYTLDRTIEFIRNCNIRASINNWIDNGLQD